jgi:hypothetical protein
LTGNPIEIDFDFRQNYLLKLSKVIGISVSISTVEIEWEFSGVVSIRKINGKQGGEERLADREGGGGGSLRQGRFQLCN